MECLDHRQLLSVNFTGNVPTDFPVSTSPGVVVLQDPNNKVPDIANDLQPIVKVSGLQINDIRVSYSSADDTLSIGIDGPLSQQVGQPGQVIAGDVDNNGNDGTVNPAITALPGREQFKDFPNFGGSETMGVFLDLNNDGTPDVVAGYSPTDPRPLKEYQVAQAIPNGTPQTPLRPDFGAELPQYEGNVYKNNSTVHPNLEFAIKDFSKLYLAETGKTLGPSSTINIGGFGNSGDDLGISEEFFHQQPLTIAQATLPPTCPPVSPPVIINPHSNSHINTAHQTLVRVNVLGSSGFDVTKINPATVTLGGATPVFAFTRYINKDEWLDGTFVFEGNQINLPRGVTQATVTGQLTDGTTFSSTVKVFNRDRSFYSKASEQGALSRQIARDTHQTGFTTVSGTTNAAAVGVPSGPLARISAKARANQVPTEAAVNQTNWTTPAATPTGPVVRIKQRQPVASNVVSKPRVSGKLNRNLNRFAKASVLDSSAATNPASSTPAMTGAA